MDQITKNTSAAKRRAILGAAAAEWLDVVEGCAFGKPTEDEANEADIKLEAAMVATGMIDPDDEAEAVEEFMADEGGVIAILADGAELRIETMTGNTSWGR